MKRANQKISTKFFLLILRSKFSKIKIYPILLKKIIPRMINSNLNDILFPNAQQLKVPNLLKLLKQYLNY